MSKRAPVKKEESKPDEKICFIISPIGKKGSPDYLHWLQVRKHIIDKVATEKGYRTLRSDDISEPGKITTQIINQLREADLVIADLSRKNANVFYELAIRDATRKPVILIGDQTVDIPFDVQPQRLLKYSIDLDEIDESRSKLSAFIDATESSGYQTTSPVTEALITPSDEISASMQDYFESIFDKINSIARSQALLALPRAVALEPVRARSIIFPRVVALSPLIHQQASVGDSVSVYSDSHTAGTVVEIYFDFVTSDYLLSEGVAGPDGVSIQFVTIPEAEIGTHYIWVKNLATGISNKVMQVEIS